MARPRSGEWLRAEISGLERIGIQTIASLLELSEEAELELSGERQIAEELGLAFVSFPISDRGIPRRLTEFQHFVRSLAEEVRAGRGVAIHCRAGIGRSGIVAAAVLVSLGHDSAEVFRLISKARGVNVPDTPEQIEWFKQNCRGFAVEK